MGWSKVVEKLNRYQERLKNGKAKKIKRSHVEKVIQKLAARESGLLAEIEETAKESKKARLREKLAANREQMERAEWLMQQIE